MGEYFTPFGWVCLTVGGGRWCLSFNMNSGLYRVLYKAGGGTVFECGVRRAGGALSGCTTCGPAGAAR